MTRILLRTVALLMVALWIVSPLAAQVRVIPKAAKGGEKQGAPWAEVPDSFRSMKLPDWPKTRSALPSPVPKGWSYSSTRLLLLSAT